MKVRVPAQNLAPELGWVLPASGRNPSSPILNCCRIVADAETGLTIETSGDDFSMRVRITEAMVDIPGEYLVPVKLFHTIAEMLWGILTLEGTDRGFRIANDTGSYTLPISDGDFPSGRFEADPLGQVDANELRAALKRIEYAIAGPKSEPPLLRAVHFLAEDSGDLILGSTNRYALAQTRIAYPGKDLNVAPDGRHVLDIVKGLLGNVTIGFSDGHFMLSDARHRAILRVYEGGYPRFEQAIAVASGSEFASSFDRADLIEALARLGKVHEKDMPVTFKLNTEGTCEISTYGEANGAGAETVQCLSTHAHEIAFNPRLLADTLLAHGNAEVIQITNGSGSPKKPMWIGHDKADVVTVINPILPPKGN